MDSGSTALILSCRSADTGRTTNIHPDDDEEMADAKEMIYGIHPEAHIF
jgi:hypothetical protein